MPTVVPVARVRPWKVLVLLAGWALLCLAPDSAAAPPDAGPASPVSIQLHVDFSRAPQRLVTVRESIRVQPGALTLYYPEWIPGEHGPNGPIANVAGLRIRGNGQPIAWRRDLRNMYAVHLQVPAGVSSLQLSFQFLPPRHSGRFGAGPSTANDLAVLAFNQVLFYPAGSPVSGLIVEPAVTLPADWQHATALHATRRQGNTVYFQALALDQLVDSPLICGDHFNQVELGTQGRAAIQMQIAGAHGTEIRPDADQVDALRQLGQQALALFGSVPYPRYQFLLMLSDDIGHFGLEHRQSGEARLPKDFFSNPTLFRVLAPLLAHEWVHAWNGKSRYPADLHAADFNTPVQTDLLWVYEGLADYWTNVLSARAGLWTPEYFHAALASSRDLMAHRSGRNWRNLQDTADAAQLAWEGSRGWTNWRRSADFYPEGQLLWLDVDTRIRELSHNRRSLDDFARTFFGRKNATGDSGGYTFEQLVAALNRVQAGDWTGFLRQRLDYTGDRLPYHGLARAGWKVVYRAKPNARDADMRSLGHGLNLAASLGLSVTGDGSVHDVQWAGPASAAGLIPGVKIVAVNGREFSLDRLTGAIAEAGQASPVTLLVRDQDVFRTLKIDYRGGLRYAHLERIKHAPDLLADIIRPRNRIKPSSTGETP